ncbi:MAG: hypothetical protein ACRCXT_03320 [Paraclostridium sp.]
MSSNYIVYGYTAEYPYINLELKNKDPESYELALIVCHVEEATKKGMKVSRIYKTTKKGTSIKYVAIKDEKDSIEYADKVEKMIIEYKAKYGK